MMRTRQIIKNKGVNTLVLGTTIGIISSCVITLLLAAVAAILVLNESVTESITPILSIVIVFVAGFSGAIITGMTVGERKLLSCIVCGCVYYFILLATKILLFEGQFSHVITTTISIVLGVVFAVVLIMRPKKQHTSRKMRKLRI